MSSLFRVVWSCVLLSVPVLCLAQNAPVTPPQAAPVGAFLGRYLDSTSTRDYQWPIRTFRTDLMKPSLEHDMLYFTIGSTFVGQKLSTFKNRLATEAMVTANRGEKILAFEKWFRYEVTGWDIQETLFGFDVDDRGNAYLCYFDRFIILNSAFQQIYAADRTGQRDVAVFRVGASYYALLSTPTDVGDLYDVTTPGSPVWLHGAPSSDGLTKSADGRIALRTASNVKIYTPAALVDNGSASYTFTPAAGTVRDVTTDGSRFYVLVTAHKVGTIHVLTPSGDTYTETIGATDGWIAYHTRINYGAGYLVLTAAADDASMYRVDANGLTLLGHDYFDGLYGQYNYINPTRGFPLVLGGQPALVMASHGLGEVFALDPVDPMTVTKAFAPSTIDSGAVSQLTVTINNPRATPVTFTLTDDYPDAVTNTASTPATTCGGTLLADSGTSSFALTNATLAANASCTVTVSVTSSTPGTHINTIPAGAIVSVDNTNAVPASAMLEVLAPFGAPPSFSATAISTTNVAMTWIGVTGATSYEIFRNNAPLMTTTSSHFTDTTASPDTSYLYKVRANGATTSDFSNSDVATTVMFTDVSLTGVAPKAAHITQLRTAVNAIRSLASLGSATFTDDSPTIIKAAHITELRTALDEARAALSLPARTYANTITAGSTVMKAVDVTELRGGTQ